MTISGYICLECGPVFELTKHDGLCAACGGDVYADDNAPKYVAELVQRVAEQDAEIERLSLNRCPGCAGHIDPDVCGCGEGRDVVHDGHSFVPMGCSCSRSDSSLLGMLAEARQSHDKARERFRQQLNTMQSRMENLLRIADGHLRTLIERTEQRDAYAARLKQCEPLIAHIRGIQSDLENDHKDRAWDSLAELRTWKLPPEVTP